MAFAGGYAWVMKLGVGGRLERRRWSYAPSELLGVGSAFADSGSLLRDGIGHWWPKVGFVVNKGHEARRGVHHKCICLCLTKLLKAKAAGQ